MMKYVLISTIVVGIWLAAVWLDMRHWDRIMASAAPDGSHEEQVRAIRQQHERLKAAYVNSMLADRIAAFAADGKGLPESILVERSAVRIIRRGTEQVFDLREVGENCFSEARIDFWPEERISVLESDYVLKPQIALAEALNQRLGDAYRICDHGVRTLTVSPEGRLSAAYTPKWVELILSLD